MRKDLSQYEILICQKDLKGLPRDRKEQLQSFLTEEDLKMEQEVIEMQKELIQEEVNDKLQPKKRRRQMHFTTSCVRKTSTNQDVSWLENTQANIHAKQQKRQ